MNNLKKRFVNSVPDLPQLTMTHWMGCVLWPILDYWTSNLTSVEWKACWPAITHRSICCLNPLERDILSTFWSFYPGGPEAKSRIITLDSCFSAYVFVGGCGYCWFGRGRGREWVGCWKVAGEFKKQDSKVYFLVYCSSRLGVFESQLSPVNASCRQPHTPFSVSVLQRCEPFEAGTLSSLVLWQIWGQLPNCVHFIDVCRQNKTKWAISAWSPSFLETLLLFKSIFTSNKDEKKVQRNTSHDANICRTLTKLQIYFTCISKVFPIWSSKTTPSGTGL